MSLLPTAHAGQAFGARRIDFYAVSGEVTQSDAGTGRVRDDEGVDHDVRLLERTSALAPGDNATLLRVQSGPNRRSRPVAIINHSREVWMRASPDATSLLARSGITRSFNWWLSILLLALTALAAVWPQLHAFFSEMLGATMASIPAFNIYNEINMLLPSLAGWRLEAALPTGLMDTIAALGVIDTAQLTEWGLAAGGLLLSLLAFSARSWRLVYMPVLAGFTLAAGAILGGAGATLILIGGAVVLFLVGGLINRIRDAGRFNARIERLAEHALRNPPQEGVRTPAAPVDAMTGAAAATAIASAAAMAQGAEDAIAEPATDGPAEAMALDATPADPDTDAANGEVEASPPIELPPAARPEAETPTEAATEDEPEADIAATATPEAEAAPAEDETTAEAEAGAETGDDGAAASGDASTEAVSLATDNEAEAEPVAQTEDEDDLPSLDAVAAAAALTAAEQGEPSPEEPVEADEQDAAPAELADDRTMAMAPPPPMPVTSPTAEPEVAPEPETASAEAPAEMPAEPVVMDAEAEPVEETAAPDPLPTPPTSEALADVESRVEEAVTAAAHAPVDDPLMEDDGPDPMMERSHESDFAPGAPELDMEKDPAE
ncbi:MAG: hypothetical protein CMF75_01135 [Maricaulis sp.]|nr:hypothetical protein [Maricaulis sp.]